MQGISRRSVGYWRIQARRLCRIPDEVSFLHCPPHHFKLEGRCVFCDPKRTYPRRNVSQRWETCPDRTLQYSYKLPTSSPMSYPKCEMEFPRWHFKARWAPQDDFYYCGGGGFFKTGLS